MRSCNPVLRVTCAISSQFSLVGPLDHLHWLLSSNQQFALASRSQSTFIGILHFTCATSLILLLFVFLSVWCIIVITQLFSIITLWFWIDCWHFSWCFHSRLKTFLFSKSSPHSHLSFAQANLLEFDHSVFVSHSLGVVRWLCDTLSQQSWLLEAL